VLSQQLGSQSGDNPSAQKQLADMQSQLASLLAKDTEDHPDVIRMRQSIADLKGKMAASQGASPAGGPAVDTPETQQLARKCISTMPS